MCTAVDGGSIHRAAIRISEASDQISTAPITSHRTKHHRKPLRRVLGCVSGFSVTFQNTSSGSVAAYASSWALIWSLALTLCASHSGHFARLRQDQQSLQEESEAEKTEDSHEDAQGKKFQGSAGYWASGAGATQVQPAWAWP